MQTGQGRLATTWFQPLNPPNWMVRHFKEEKYDEYLQPTSQSLWLHSSCKARERFPNRPLQTVAALLKVPVGLKRRSPQTVAAPFKGPRGFEALQVATDIASHPVSLGLARNSLLLTCNSWRCIPGINRVLHLIPWRYTVWLKDSWSSGQRLRSPR